MQAEEVQKELEELKATRLQEATAEMNDRMKNAEHEISQLQLKLRQSELDSGESSRKLANSEQEKDDAVKQVKAVEERERELHGQLTRLREVFLQEISIHFDSLFLFCVTAAYFLM